MSASLASFLAAVVPLLLVVAGVGLLLFPPRKLAKAMRRTWRRRKPSLRREHTVLASKSLKARKKAEERAWNDIVANYAQTAPGHNKPREGPR